MAFISYHRLVLLFGLSLFYIHLAECQSTPERKTRPRSSVRVGDFPIHLNDNRLNQGIEIANENITEMNCLYNLTLNYWLGNEDPQPIANETAALNEFAKECLIIPENSGYHSWALANANQSLSENLAFFDNNETQLWNDSFTDLSSLYLWTLDNGTEWLPFRLVDAYMGVGRTVECSDIINTLLAGAGEWEKAGSAAATTLMALIPTFLAFGNL
jgi:hypothetical protein